MNLMWVWIVSSVYITWKCFAEGPLPLDLREVTACYGHGDLDRDFLRLRCPLGARIAVYTIEHAGKLKNESCPAVLTANDTKVLDCCTTDPADCRFNLHHKTKWNYFEQCSGLRECSVRAGRERPTMVCDTSLHMDLSNYMVANYYCVPESTIFKVENTLQLESASLHVSHMSYPTNMTSQQGYQCYASTACDSTVNIMAVDLRLGCNQWLEMKDGSRVFNVTCTYNNEYYMRSIYVTSSHVIGFGVPDGFRGQFWFYLSASSSNTTLRINCGQQGMQYSGDLCTSSAVERSTDHLFPSELYLSSMFQTEPGLGFEDSYSGTYQTSEDTTGLMSMDVFLESSDLEGISRDTDLASMDSNIMVKSSLYDIVSSASESITFDNSDVVVTGSESVHVETELYQSASAAPHDYSVSESNYNDLTSSESYYAISETTLMPSLDMSGIDSSFSESSYNSPGTGYETTRTYSDSGTSGKHPLTLTNVVSTSPIAHASSVVTQMTYAVRSSIMAFSYTVLSSTTTTQSTTRTAHAANSSQLSAIVGGSVGCALLLLISAVILVKTFKGKSCSNKIADVKAEEGRESENNQHPVDHPDKVEPLFSTTLPVSFNQVPLMTVKTGDEAVGTHSTWLPPLTNNNLQICDGRTSQHQSNDKIERTLLDKHYLPPIEHVRRSTDAVSHSTTVTDSTDPSDVIKRLERLIPEINTVSDNTKRKKKKKKHKKERKRLEEADLHEHIADLDGLLGVEETGHESRKKKKQRKHKEVQPHLSENGKGVGVMDSKGPENEEWTPIV